MLPKKILAIEVVVKFFKYSDTMVEMVQYLGREVNEENKVLDSVQETLSKRETII